MRLVSKKQHFQLNPFIFLSGTVVAWFNFQEYIHITENSKSIKHACLTIYTQQAIVVESKSNFLAIDITYGYQMNSQKLTY